MFIHSDFKALTLVLTDIIVFYIALISTLLYRYSDRLSANFEHHLLFFTPLFLIWIVIFYAFGLYSLYRLRMKMELATDIIIASIFNIVISSLFFYFKTDSIINPKTNLIIIVVISAALIFIYRLLFNNVFKNSISNLKILFLTNGKETDELKNIIIHNPVLGYTLWKNESSDFNPKNYSFNGLEKPDVVIIESTTNYTSNILKQFYNFKSTGMGFQEIYHFYETVCKKVPLFLIDKPWFLLHFTGNSKQYQIYNACKRIIDIIVASLMFIITLPLMIMVGLIILLLNGWPIIYTHKRVGKNNKHFIVYKFRTMIKNAETNEAKWAQVNDSRITLVGNFLRKTRLDELPQLINIIKGDMSFVGPRPERPEFTKYLEQDIPYYNLRHQVLPGITGWAQINYTYGASVEDSTIKLCYDLYYIKHASIILDLKIMLKTLYICVRCLGR